MTVLRRLDVAEVGADLVVAGVDLGGEGEVDGGDAVVAGLQCAFEDLVALGVLDLERQRHVADGREVDATAGTGPAGAWSGRADTAACR